MTTQTTYGFTQLEDGDTGDTVWDAFKDNITRTDAHTHDGENSAPIESKSLSKGTSSLETTDFSLDSSTGMYRATVTMPDGYEFDTAIISCREATSGDVFYPSLEKITDTSFYLYQATAADGVEIIYG